MSERVKYASTVDKNIRAGGGGGVQEKREISKTWIKTVPTCKLIVNNLSFLIL